MKLPTGILYLPVFTAALIGCAKISEQSELGSSRLGVRNFNVLSNLVPLAETNEVAEVKVYTYHPSEKKLHRVIFKYADLINRAIEYKNKNKAAVIEINFALYKISKKIYVGINPEHNTYAQVNGEDFAGANSEHSEKLVTTIARAMKTPGIQMRFLYQNPKGDNGIAEFFGTVGPSKIRRVVWGEAGRQQMHNKFITIKTSGKDLRTSHTIYTSTANGDEFDEEFTPLYDVSQTGVLVRGNQKLHAAYARYFDVMWEHAFKPIGEFQTRMDTLHRANALNHKDEHFSAYFFPLPKLDAPKGPKLPLGPNDDHPSGWLSDYNPVAALVNKVQETRGPRHVKIVSFYCGTASGVDAFADELANKLKYTRERDKDTSSFVHVRSVINNTHGSPDPVCPIEALDGQKTKVRTHEKNMQFAFGREQEFYSMTGSANLGTSEFRSKANNILVILERTRERPIYTLFKEQFYESYENGPFSR